MNVKLDIIFSSFLTKNFLFLTSAGTEKPIMCHLLSRSSLGGQRSEAGFYFFHNDLIKVIL